jgi:transmembrane sensor
MEAQVAPGEIVKSLEPDVQRAIAWRARRLVFHSNRLDEVVQEFNRYNRIPIRLEGAEIADRRISGVFDADDTQPLIDFLSSNPDFAVIRADHEILVHKRP